MDISFYTNTFSISAAHTRDELIERAYYTFVDFERWCREDIAEQCDGFTHHAEILQSLSTLLSGFVTSSEKWPRKGNISDEEKVKFLRVKLDRNLERPILFTISQIVTLYVKEDLDYFHRVVPIVYCYMYDLALELQIEFGEVRMSRLLHGTIAWLWANMDLSRVLNEELSA